MNAKVYVSWHECSKCMEVHTMMHLVALKCCFFLVFILLGFAI